MYKKSPAYMFVFYIKKVELVERTCKTFPCSMIDPYRHMATTTGYTKWAKKEQGLPKKVE